MTNNIGMKAKIIDGLIHKGEIGVIVGEEDNFLFGRMYRVRFDDGLEGLHKKTAVRIY